MFDAQDLIKQAIERHKPYIYVAFSGGKCSEVVLHMAIKVWKDIPVVFNNTGVEFPQGIEFIRMVAKDWNLNLIETKPKKSFWECVKDHGFPDFKSTRRRKNNKINTPRCCYYLKEVPYKRVIKENKFMALFTGLRAEESWNRRMLDIKMSNKSYQDGQKMCGQRYFAKAESVWKYHPIMHWTTEDVWNYIKQNNLPYNKAYDLPYVERTGCLPCTAHMYWERQILAVNPKLYRMIQHKRGVNLITDYGDFPRAELSLGVTSPERIYKTDGGLSP